METPTITFKIRLSPVGKSPLKSFTLNGRGAVSVTSTQSNVTPTISQLIKKHEKGLDGALLHPFCGRSWPEAVRLRVTCVAVSLQSPPSLPGRSVRSCVEVVKVPRQGQPGWSDAGRESLKCWQPMGWAEKAAAAAVEDCQSIYAHLAGPVQRIAQVQASAGTRSVVVVGLLPSQTTFQRSATAPIVKRKRKVKEAAVRGESFLYRFRSERSKRNLW